MTSTRHPRTLIRPRRGISAPALLMAVMMTLLFLVLVVDLAQLSIQKHQMRIGANASSLTAAAEIMDQRWLYLGPEGSGESAQATQLRFDNVAQIQTESAIQKAADFAAMKEVGGQSIVLGAEDIRFGWVNDPADRQTPAADLGPHGAWNSATVNVSRTKAGGNPPLLWMAQQTGLDRIDLSVQSMAMVDTRLHGFRPLKRVRVPLVPLAVLPDLEDLAMSDDGQLPEQIWWAKGPADDYTVDTKSEEVFEGGDGIAEMVVRLRVKGNKPEPEQGSSSDEEKRRRGAICKLLGERDTYEFFASLALWGLGPEDLAGLDGQITTGDDPPAIIPADFELESEEVRFVHAALLQLQGRPRVWPVAATVSSAVGQPAIGVIGFVAGSVVSCRTDGDGSLLVVIQPCVLQTPTALTSADSLRNPWIGKLLLIR